MGKKQLYLTVDYMGGPRVHKVDLPSNSDFDDDAMEQLPAPFTTLEPQHVYSKYIMAALGENIIAMPLTQGDDFYTVIGKELTVFNVRSKKLRLGPHPPVELVNPIFIPTDERLFVLSSDSFHVLNLPSVEEAGGTGSWCELPRHPFKEVYITSSAVHPDGRIFVSTKHVTTSIPATYMFDMAQPVSQWKKVGDWEFPFSGHAHFYRTMNAWVGILDRFGVRTICACDVVTLELDGNGWQFPSSRILEEDLFSADFLDDERHVGADLVFNGKRFCLVECVLPFEGYCSVFRVTKFSLKYNEDGDLAIGHSVKRQSYEVPNPHAPHGYSLVDPLAFWM